MSYTWLQKIFIHINFCKVNMNYMWNDIHTCYVEWYMSTMLSSSRDTFSWQSVHSEPDLPISTLIIETVYQKLHWQYAKWKISISRYISEKNIHVIIYEISIISSYCHWNLLWTAITCTTISTLMKFCNHKWNKDLQQFSTEKWLEMSYEIYLPYSHIHYPLLLQ